MEMMLCAECQPDELYKFGAGWISQTKNDGRRMQIHKSGNSIKMFGRDHDIDLDAYPEIVKAIAAVPGDFKIDGEACVMVGGKSDFESLQSRDKTKDPFRRKLLEGMCPATYVAFDIIELNSLGLTTWPLSERLKVLETLLQPYKSDRLQTAAVYYDTQTLWQKALDNGWEGIVIKRADSIYVPQRSSNWVKCKIKHQEEMVALAYQLNPKGIRCDLEGGLAVQVSGAQAEAVKQAIDLNGSAKLLLEGLGSGRTEDGAIRQIVFVRLVE